MQKQVSVKVVGIGANGETFYKNIIEKAELLLGGSRHLSMFEHLKCEKMVLGKNLKDILKHLPDKYKKNIVVIASGDPLFFGIGTTLLSIFDKNCVEFYPYLNSIQYLCNKVKVAYEDVVNLSVHGKEIEKNKILHAIATNSKISILTDKTNNITQLINIIKELTMFPLTLYIGQMLGTSDENIIITDINSLPEIEPSQLDTMLIVNEKPIWNYSIGIEDSLFKHEKGLITKKEIRVISLSYLNLKKNSVVWDIGAGSGSVSIEASFLAPEGEIYAIEKNFKRIKNIEENIKKFHRYNITTVTGEASFVLSKLPVASRVFIGGNSGGILRILNQLKKVLKKNSIVVINLVSVDKLGEVISFCKDNSLDFQSSMVQASRLTSIAENYYYKGSNSVYIFKIVF